MASNTKSLKLTLFRVQGFDFEVILEVIDSLKQIGRKFLIFIEASCEAVADLKTVIFGSATVRRTCRLITVNIKLNLRQQSNRGQVVELENNQENKKSSRDVLQALR